MEKKTEVAKTDRQPLFLLAGMLLFAGLLYVTVNAFLLAPQKPASTTGLLVAPQIEPTPPITVSQTVVQTAPISDILKNQEKYAGQRVGVEGKLGHRERSVYGWNLRFDLFDTEGNSIRINGIAPETKTDARYQATGTIRSNARTGPEMDDVTLTPLD